MTHALREVLQRHLGSLPTLVHHNTSVTQNFLPTLSCCCLHLWRTHEIAAVTTLGLLRSCASRRLNVIGAHIIIWPVPHGSGCCFFFFKKKGPFCLGGEKRRWFVGAFLSVRFAVLPPAHFGTTHLLLLCGGKIHTRCKKKKRFEGFRCGPLPSLMWRNLSKGGEASHALR